MTVLTDEAHRDPLERHVVVGHDARERRLGWLREPGGRHTGQYSTNDPEEIDCPDCDGTGFATPEPAPFLGVVLDDTVPF